MFGLSFSARDSQETMSTVIPQCATAFIRQLFILADTNSDMEISFQEFEACLSRTPEAFPWFSTLMLLSTDTNESMTSNDTLSGVASSDVEVEVGDLDMDDASSIGVPSEFSVLSEAESWAPPQIALSEEHRLQLRAESVMRLFSFKSSFSALQTDTNLRVFNN
jgi:hypothetical protein